ncbi:hypothetical protein BE17_34210 [Sorangium cellulosum]|uniref:Secreted protein n=1 Tax=Sorangium cellulosum TaxID=56 RepID=A0A150RMM6_SORCE|nr:hypothetical protein BE17_34210 [Sorangium cellulosum]
MTINRTTFAVGIVCLLLCAPVASGCITAEQTAEGTADEFEVTSSVETGLLARVDYHGDGYVEFLRDREGGVFIAAAFKNTGFDPLRGIHLGGVLPSELFTYLTDRRAPAELVAAEREAGLPSNPEAFAARERPIRADIGPSEVDRVGTATSALTGDDFQATYCFPGTDFCEIGLSGDRRVDSGRRVDVTDGVIDVPSDSRSSLRIRVRSKRVIGSDNTLSTYVVNPGHVHRFAGATGIERHMYVTVDFAEFAKYNLSVDFID